MSQNGQGTTHSGGRFLNESQRAAFIPKYYTAVRRQRILPGHVRDHTFPN